MLADQTSSTEGPCAADDIRQNLRSKANLALQQGQLEKALSFTRQLLALPDRPAGDFYLQGQILAAGHQHQMAHAAFAQAVARAPDHLEAIYNLAVASEIIGNLPQAQRWFQKAVDVQPEDPDLRCQLAKAHISAGDLDAAGRVLKIIMQRWPDHAAAHHLLGTVHKRQGDNRAGTTCFQRAIALDPENADVYNNLGLLLQSQGRVEAAIATLEKAVALQPEKAVLYFNLGFAYQMAERWQKAQDQYQKALAIDPQMVMALQNLGSLLKMKGRPADALDCFQRALAIEPESAEIINNLGNALEKTGDWQGAIECLQKALEIQPEYPEAFNNLGVAHSVAGHYCRARHGFDQALRIRPDFAEAQFNRAVLLLLHGELGAGWQAYESRFQKTDVRDVYPYRYDLPRWDGGIFANRTLYIHDEQGFGDAIQFVRYLPEVKKLGGRVVFETRAPLMPLFAEFAGIDHLVLRPDRAEPVVDADMQVALMSLPNRMHTDSIAQIPQKTPYLRADPKRVDKWADRIGGNGGLRIGLVWSGNPGHENDHHRSIPLDLLQPLLSDASVDWVILQKGISKSEQALLTSYARVILVGDQLADFADTAAVIDQLDLLITVDTAAAHLAGAMDKPVWVLLPYAPDWRWLLDRADSPWYPAARLFRQPAPGNWVSVIERIEGQLQVLSRVKDGPGVDSETVEQQAVQILRLVEKGQLAAAEQSCRHLLAVAGDQGRVANLCGVVAMHRDHQTQAAAHFRKAIELQPREGHFHLNLGKVLMAQQKLPEALAALKDADEQLVANAPAGQIRSLAAEIKCLQAKCLHQTGESFRADEMVQQALAMDPDHPDAWHLRGIWAGRNGDAEQACQALARVVALQPDQCVAHNNLGAAYEAAGRYPEALDCFKRSLQLSPDDPDARFYTGLLRLKHGDFEKGWPDYEFRRRKAPFSQLPSDRPMWQGQDFEGKRLLVRQEQGLGDNLQFARYLPMVKKRGGTVLLECWPSLLPLFKGFDGVDQQVVRRPAGMPAADHDFYVHLLSLPAIFKTSLETIPEPGPSFFVDPQLVRHWRERLPEGRPRIGLVWSGNPAHANDYNRSCTIKALAPLLRQTRYHWISLQKNDASAVRPEPLPACNWMEVGSQLTDFADTAAVISQLDLVISVDTAVAHLAGMMGKPVWIMIPFVPDWRWLLHRSDSPWYPTVRLFRQTTPGDWKGVVADLCCALHQWPAQPNPTGNGHD